MDEIIKKIKEHYLNKEELKFRIPRSTNLDDFWDEIQKMRKLEGIETPLKDQNGEKFFFNIDDKTINNMNIINDKARIDIFNEIPADMEISLINDSMIDEAYNSSVIEGAFSTKKRTKEMIDNKEDPKNNSEQMILNNYKALEYIMDNISNPLNEEVIIDIYKILTEKTLKDDEIVEKYRNDFVGVWDVKQNRYTYEAPEHEKVQGLMNDLCKFINENNNINPLIKGCIIHFYFVYIHPFFDGNGRTARAITYMYLVQEGYDFFRFFSISSMIQEERNRYYKAIENTEIYDSDLTYFVDYYLGMIVKSIIKILGKFQAEFGKKIIKQQLDKLEIILNKRLMKVINYFITSEKNIITIDDYMKKYKVAYETARTDLKTLTDLGFFKQKKSGKKYIFIFNKINIIRERLNELED